MATNLEFSAFLFDPIRKIPESTQDSKDKPDFDIPSVMALLKWISSY
jgi:hypothetical protein